MLRRNETYFESSPDCLVFEEKNRIKKDAVLAEIDREKQSVEQNGNVLGSGNVLGHTGV